jgi:hypothetical protein
MFWGLHILIIAIKIVINKDFFMVMETNQYGWISND